MDKESGQNCKVLTATDYLPYLQYKFKQFLSIAAFLSRLVHIKVQYAEWLHFMLLTKTILKK